MAVDNEHFKEKLVAEKQALEEELRNLGRPNPLNPGDWEITPNLTDTEFKDEVADKLEENEERQAVEVEIEARFREVVHALNRLEAGTYGICEIGGEEIEADRLEANPAARTCKAHLEQEDSLPPIK